MMDEEIRQALNEVREMKQMCGNINMKLTNIVTQRGQDYKKKLEAEYQKGINDGSLDVKQRVEGAYQRGLEDAWECAKKLFSTISDTEIEKVFPTEWENGFYGLMQMKPQYAIDKLKAYEEKQKADEDVKRGDVVRHKINGLTYIVTLANESGYVLLDSDGNFATSCITNSFEKTGKHVDIDKILEGLRYDS